ncbi:uncharacterized protein LOC129767270 isoform X2 [Toxorhynchites rutilus septentrionalis]|uniref:uncharacterized protein LOC129767270 isoform X2 n=1 Tax=Toxorhynchites rutilus septentrionalis TaxID=329112 RepID=UPI00247987D1|nr:uncharacterized protein LOC129767270 isoform X2 [Toxorhynchites rutilus septentrionalis]
MVNKQYNVHHPKLPKPKSGQNSPSPMVRNYPEVSNQPNPPSGAGSLENNLNRDGGDQHNHHHHNQNLHNSQIQSNLDLDVRRRTGGSISPSIEDFGEDGVYGRNISYYSETAQLGGNESPPGGNHERLSVKDLTISDIGRFQYILQMDREVGTPYSGYTSSSSQHSPSAPNSLPSHLHSNRQGYNFWKAGSQSPLTSASSINSFFRPLPQSRCYVWRAVKMMWRFVKWPLALLLVCSLLALVVYFLMSDRGIMTSTLLDETKGYEVEENLSIDFNDFTHTNNLDSGPETTFGRDHKDNSVGFSKDGNAPNTKFSFGMNNDLLAIFVKKGDQNRNEGQSIWTSTEHENLSEEVPATVVKITSSTTHAPIRKTSTISLKDYTKARVSFDDDEFTSEQQQNNEQTTRAINADIDGISRQRNLSTTSSTTDSSFYRTKVSPTLPILSRFEITTEGLKRFNISEEGICKSTSLPLCRGILPYDLTTLKNRHLTAVEYEHFQYLINSKCSIRVAEFVCLVLEPECRPTRMGTLTPCKRICKSILEPCAHIIASSEVLTSTFDCDIYPDSNDQNVCEDPTRRSNCFANEFRCADSSCIPLQWKCDNIKDCQDGEDESDCKFCERDEYRCLSNDKCIPDKWRCDQYEDCPDASDELDCYYDEPTTFPSGPNSQREYPYVQVQVPNSPVNGKPYLTITNADRERKKSEQQQQPSPDYESSGEDGYEPTAAENVPQVDRKNQTEPTESNKDRIEDQTEAETIRTVSVPKSLVNFQDSKEIMMTSDSENDYKFSSTSRSFLTTAHASPCPEGELRCVSGICISVNQLCDKVADCADGADEAMCVYKE